MMTLTEKLRNDYERNKKMKEMLDSGKTLKEVADSFNVSIGLPSFLKKDFDHAQKNIEKKIEFYEDVVAMYKEGYKAAQIADLHETTKQNVSRIIKSMGVSRSEGGVSKLKKETIKKIKSLASKDYTLEDISEALDLDIARVRQYCYEEKIDILSGTKVRVESLKKEVLKLREEGKFQHDIADELDISQTYVSKILLNEDLRSFKTREDYNERDTKVYQAFVKGQSFKEIMENFDLNESNVRRIIYKFKKTEESKKSVESKMQ